MIFCFCTTAIAGISNLLLVFTAMSILVFNGAFQNRDDLLETILQWLPLIFFGVAEALLIRCAVIIKKKIRVDKQKRTFELSAEALKKEIRNLTKISTRNNAQV